VYVDPVRAADSRGVTLVDKCYGPEFLSYR
jgi:hypothetical protein